MDQTVKDKLVGQIEADQVVDLCSSLLKIPSFKTEETDVGKFLADFFESRDYIVDLQEVEPGRLQTVATLKGTGGGPSLMLNGHTDIDPLAYGWKRDPWTPTVEGDRLYGAGSNNMKGGLASVITASEAIRTAGVAMRGDLVVACVVGELQGGIGTLHALGTGLRTDGAVVAEPVGDADNIITGHVGMMEVAISTIGLSKHITRVHEGAIDAIDLMVKAIPAIKKVKFTHTPSPHFPDAPRMIVGTVVGGRGRDHDLRGPNFTSDYCTIVVDVRTVPGQTAETVKADLSKVLDGLKAENRDFDYEIVTPPPPHYRVVTVNMNPFVIPTDAPIVEPVRRNYREATGRDPDGVGSIPPQAYSGNDTCHLWEAGIPCCIFGPRGGRDFKGEPDTFVYVSSMVTAAQVLALTAVDWCNSTESR